jgi:hypothetical protein
MPLRLLLAVILGGVAIRAIAGIDSRLLDYALAALAVVTAVYAVEEFLDGREHLCGWASC